MFTSQMNRNCKAHLLHFFQPLHHKELKWNTVEIINNGRFKMVHLLELFKNIVKFVFVVLLFYIIFINGQILCTIFKYFCKVDCKKIESSEG